MDSLATKRKKLGKLLMAGFEGTTVTPKIRTLIESYHIPAIILSSKNFENVRQTKTLIYELQQVAKNSGYKYPIAFAIDQEGGMVSSLFDEDYITQFPGAMALSATASPDLIYNVTKAMGTELKSIGFSINLGPVLDIVTKFSHQLIGVRSFGSTAEEVITYASAAARGLRDGGLLTFGKHFPGLNNAEISSLLELPMLTETLEQIENVSVITFKALMDMNLLDGLEASGAAVPNISPNEFHACLSTAIMNDLLRRKLKFNGVVISECLEMEVLFSNLGFKQGVIMAAFATCDLILVCHNFDLQVEAVNALIQAMDDGILDDHIVNESFKRITDLQQKLPTWEEVFNIPDISRELRMKHVDLSQTAYRRSITLVRDFNDSLPLTRFLKDSDLGPENNGLLLLTPVITPLYSKNTAQQNVRYFPGEEVFQEFGRKLSSYKTAEANFKVFHTSYTANGLTNLHEKLIEKCKAVILITSETSRNLHQIGIAKHISVLCGGNIHKAPTRKPLIIVAVSSPYDFIYSKNIGSAYLCTYEYTDNALEKLAAVLFGVFNPVGCIPGEKPKPYQREDDVPAKRRKKDSAPSRWLVDEFDIKRDWNGLVALAMTQMANSDSNANSIEDSNDNDLNERPKDEKSFKRYLTCIYKILSESQGSQKMFVVRNSSLNTLHGAISTWYYDRFNLGAIVFIIVDPSKRNQAIGQSLHKKAVKYLLNERKVEKITLGCSFPLVMFPSLEMTQLAQHVFEQADDAVDDAMLENPSLSFLIKNGWTLGALRKDYHDSAAMNYILKLDNLQNWSVSKKLVRQLQVVGIMFDICQNITEVLQLLEMYHSSNPFLYEAYRAAAMDTGSPLKVIVALEPTNKSVVGSVIVFTNECAMSKYYPFLEYTAPEFGALSGLMIDPSYENLTDVFKLGLVCTSLSYLKKQNENLNVCVLIGINKKSNNINNFKDTGFSVHEQYHDHYDSKDAEDKWCT